MTQLAGNNTSWFVATVARIVEESPTVKTFTFETPHPIYNLAGQHFELRLTAENGYQAARLYSAATANDGTPTITLTIMDIPDGEVSPYVNHMLAIGDQVELRGPFGKFFVWTPAMTEPIFLIAGGSGVVPMHSFLTAHAASGNSADMRLLYSSHAFDDILYKKDFLNNADVTMTLTRSAPENWGGKTGRINADLITELLDTFTNQPLCYVCGVTGFVDAVTRGLQAAGIPASMIKTERFG